MVSRQDESAQVALAAAARVRGDLREAHRVLAEVVRANPENAEARRELALVMSIGGDRAEAVEQMRRALAAEPERAAWQYDMGDLLTRVGRLEEARESFVRAEGLDPRNALYPGRIAAVSRRLRDHDGARAAARRALEIDADQEFALLVVSQEALREGELDEAEEAARRLVERAATVSGRASGWHAVGQALERRGRWDEAFDAHGAANEEMLRTPAAREALRSEIAGGFGAFLGHGDGAERYARWGGKRLGDRIEAPVILTGFPRSGTTMTEQILGAHPGIATSDERDLCLPVLAEMGRMLGDGGFRPLLEQMDGLSDEQIGRLRVVYREGLERGVDEEARGRVLVDKHPLRIIDLGLINRIFPEARVMVLIRDPRDVCLSALFQNFAVNPGMVRFLSPRLCADWYAKVMGFWLRLREMLSIEVLEVRYEELVSDFDGWSARMIAFAGLEWDERVRDFHEAAGERVVLSASYEAVAERLNTRSIGRWKNYAEKLEPMMERLEPFVEAFGYGGGSSSG